METIKNKIPPYATHFFKKLSNYLNTRIYFFGSVQRNDYFPESSDIDADIFTDNMSSTLIKLQSFLNVNKYQFKHFVYKLHKTNNIVYLGTNIITPLPEAEEGDGARVGYFRSEPNKLFFSIPTNQNILY